MWQIDVELGFEVFACTESALYLNGGLKIQAKANQRLRMEMVHQK